MNRNRPDPIDQTLAHLGSVQIPHGFEQRLLSRLAIAEQTSSPPPQPSPAPHHHPWLSSIGLPAAAVIAVVAILLPRPHPASPPPHVSRAPQAAATPAPVPAAATNVSSSRLTNYGRHSVRSLKPPPSYPGPDSSDDALALAESEAPTQLAPSLPLTDDERALQHLARRSTPATLLALDPARRAADQAADQAAFVSFFTPPVLPHRELTGASE